MTYVQKYYKEIFLNALNNALKQGLISHEEEFINYIKDKQDISNFYVMLLSIHSEVFEQVYDDMTKIYESSKLSLADGSDLDDIGLLVNCPRPTATKAGVELTFTMNKAYDVDKTEPAGIQVTTNTGIVYETVEELYFPAGETECTVYAYATEAGVKSRVVENQLNKIISKLTNVEISISCTNVKASNGGNEAYDDESYRELVSNWIKIKQRGNEWAYREYFARVDGIDDYSLVPNWDGTGTIKIIISPGTKYLLNKIYDELKREVTQISEDIVLMAPVPQPIDIYAVCNVDIDRANPYSTTEKDEISGKIRTSIIEYIDNLKIGEDFIPFKLGVFVDENVPELKNITFKYPTEPVTITDEEQCSIGEIEILME